MQRLTYRINTEKSLFHSVNGLRKKWEKTVVLLFQDKMHNLKTFYLKQTVNTCHKHSPFSASLTCCSQTAELCKSGVCELCSQVGYLPLCVSASSCVRRISWTYLNRLLWGGKQVNIYGRHRTTAAHSECYNNNDHYHNHHYCWTISISLQVWRILKRKTKNLFF